MAKSHQLAGLLLLGAGIGLCEQTAKNPGKGSANPAFRTTLPKGAAPKGPALRNPGSWAARLYRATPENRERVLERLSAAQQKRIRDELKWFDGLSKDHQQIVLKRLDTFDALSPEKRRAFQEQRQALNRLPPERSRAVRQALMRLQSQPDERRKEILADENFRSKFSAEEFQMLTDLAAVMIPPME